MEPTHEDLFWNDFIAEQERLIDEEKIMKKLEENNIED